MIVLITIAKLFFGLSIPLSITQPGVWVPYALAVLPV